MFYPIIPIAKTGLPEMPPNPSISLRPTIGPLDQSGLGSNEKFPIIDRAIWVFRLEKMGSSGPGFAGMNAQNPPFSPFRQVSGFPRQPKTSG
jgi:hypothetical protein